VQAQVKAMGGPVPGAEIYIELEPGNKQIANVTTNDNGEVSGFIPISPAPAPIPNGIKIFFKFPEKTWRYLAARYGKTSLLGGYHFRIATGVGTNKYEKEFSIEIKETNYLMLRIEWFRDKMNRF
jgi:hypothetical protein